MNTQPEMKLWECKYHVLKGNSEFNVTDWVWSTSKPVGNSIGHYWRVLHKAIITNGISYLAPEGVNTDNAIMSNHRYITSESGQAGLLLLILIVAVIVCLYVAYTGISEASTGTNNLFGYMITKLSEVLR